jgi:hypothetical protein
MNFLCQSGFKQTLLPKEEEREIQEDGTEKEEEENLKDMAFLLHIIPTYRNLMPARRILSFDRPMSASVSRSIY